MKKLLFFCLLFLALKAQSQTNVTKFPTANIRLSFLIFPPITPLLTFEIRTFENLTVQLETNFINTHGINLKYFVKERMNGHFMFVGSAFIESDFLRKDKSLTFLPYAGYGYAYRFGKSNVWIFDSRLGVGATINADKNTFLPVLKAGIGRTF
jgi:hypothetical protein